MSASWRPAAILLAIAAALLTVGQFMDWDTGPRDGVPIGAILLSYAGMGLGVLGLLFLVGALAGDVGRSRDARDREPKEGKPV
jgi:hypothetical protein